jgi:AmiR/NasT family two-component response regulator
MTDGPSRSLRVVLIDGSAEYLEHVGRIVTGLGHAVIARETEPARLATFVEDEQPDVAIVLVGDNTRYALDMIRTIVREAICPTIALLAVQDTAFVREAAKCGIFAYIANEQLVDDELEGAIDIVLRRFAEYHDLQGAFGRRAMTERAKGILMERHRIDEDAAFRMLRDHARTHGRKLTDVVQVVLDARSLLPATQDSETPPQSR